MTVSESTRTRTAVIEESTAGTQPAGALLVVPKARCTLRDVVRTQESALIRSDANLAGLHKTSSGISGQLDTELIYSPPGEGINLLMQAALRTTATAATTQVTGVACTSNVLSGGSGNVETGVEAGDIVRVRTSADVLLGYYLVTAVNTGTHTVTVAGTLANGTGYKVQRGQRMKNGTSNRSFSLEHARLDTGLYQIFRGLTVGRMGLTVNDDQICQVQFGLEGMTTARDTSTYGASGHTDPTVAPSFTATSVPMVRVGGNAFEFMSLNVNFDTRPRARRIVGTESPVSYGHGEMMVSGSIDAYLESWTELAKYAAGTDSSLQFAIQDASGNAYALSLPSVRWMDAETSTDRKDSDEMQRLRFQAKLDATESLTARLLQWAN